MGIKMSSKLPSLGANGGVRYYHFVMYVTVDDYIWWFRCHECSHTGAAPIRIEFESIRSDTTGFIVTEGSVLWYNLTEYLRDRFAEGKPICPKCWDEEELPKIFHLSRFY